MAGLNNPGLGGRFVGGAVGEGCFWGETGVQYVRDATNIGKILPI